MSEPIFCANCDAEAVFIISHPGNAYFQTLVCSTCKTAFEWGQASPDATCEPIEKKEVEQS